MANCEEKSCANVQSAICLHCNHRLCAPHIVAHGTLLLAEADELCEQINNVAEQLNGSFEQIRAKRNDAVDAVDVWRRKEIDKIEDQYAAKIQLIESKQDDLIELETELSQRLVTDARQPLERMQIQNSANTEVIQAIRQALADIRQKSRQLEWNSVASLDQSSSFDINNVVIRPHQQLQSDDQQRQLSNLSEIHAQQHGAMYPVVDPSYLLHRANQSADKYRPAIIHVAPAVNSSGYIPHPLMNALDFSRMIRPQFEYSHTRAHRPQLIATYATPAYPRWRSQTPASTPGSFIPSPQKPTISTGSQIDIKRLPTNSNPTLIALFMNVSGLNDQILDNFVVNHLTRAVHVNHMMVLLLSFLEAWHCKTSPTVYNERVLSYHIFTVQKYINGRDHELTVMAAILVYINSCGYDESKSGRIMAILLQQFFDHKCITRTTILDWYENGAAYGYNDFQRVKQWVRPFIDQLNTVLQLK